MQGLERSDVHIMLERYMMGQGYINEGAVKIKDRKMSKSDEQIQKESDRKIRSEAKKALPTTSRKGGAVADWTNADPTLVLQLVCTVACEGGAVRFGYTRDGGAYSIGLYLGDASKTYYCNEAEGINEQIRELIEYFN